MAELLDHEQPISDRHQVINSSSILVHRVPQWCSLFAAAIAMLVLVGWATHFYALVTVLPSLPAMARSTAGAFLLSSGALWLVATGRGDARARRLSQILALAAALAGLATLLRFSLGVFGHGPLLTHGSASGRPINHMSPNSAINFVLLGMALFLADVRGRGERRPSQIFCLVATLDALTALIGQIFGVTFLYGLSPLLGMAVHTAVVFLILAVGLLLARPDRGFVAVLLADDAAGRAARRFLPLALLAPVVLGGVGLLGQRLSHDDTPFMAYLLVVASIGLLGWLVWCNVLALAAQVRRSQAAERQGAEIERRRVEEALAASEQRLLFTIEGAGIGTWSWDIEMDHLVWSATCKALFGLPPETQMTRALFFERIHPDDRRRAEATIGRSLAEGTAYDIEYRVVRPDGQTRWVAAKGRGYHDGLGRPVRFEGTVQDIDDRRLADERQRRFLTDVLASVTEGHLILCQSEAELPAPLTPFSETIALSVGSGLRELRQAVYGACRFARLPEGRGHDLVTATGEAAMNCVVHVGSGLGQVSADERGGTVQVCIRDDGPGISLNDLPHATLRRGFTTAGTLGHGMKMMLETADRVHLQTGPGGTTVVLGQGREATSPPWL